MINEYKRLPAIALRGLTVLPTMVVHFDISRERSIKSLEAALHADQEVFLVSQIDPEMNDPQMKDLYSAGTVALVRNVAKMPQNILRIMAEGVERAVLLDLVEIDGCLHADICLTKEESLPAGTQTDAMCRALKDLFTVYASENGRISKDLLRQVNAETDPEKLITNICVNLPFDSRIRQQILDAASMPARYEVLCSVLAEEVEVLRIRNDIQHKVKERVDKNQKEYILREQLKVIEEELGEDLPVNDAAKYREQAQRLDAPDEVKEKIFREIGRFKSLGSNSAESSVSRTYIETLLEMPWNKRSEDNTDLRNAQKILDEDHFGLEKVKERVLEFIAVRALAPKGDSPILCLVGPPGTGKTSVARSIAKALGREYVRISLGGVRDEAEIRGHRRTYIGAMPGRIAVGLKNAGVSNPLMLLDEVDKLSSSYNGDPSSALLEVLDSEQNCRFSDHYIEIPTDLSQVMFVATANDASTIPKPLLDRMEVIEVSSYTANEKLHIAKDHLVKKQLERNGLTAAQLKITGGALSAIINGYTQEAGVRQLERKIGQICRKAAMKILSGEETSLTVKKGNISDYLGRERVTIHKRNEKDEVGIVRGLAWTSVGGVTLETEVNVLPGSGEFVLTGQLGDVMKESARAAVSYVRSVADRYDITPDYFKEHEIHIHIPEGAVPKDGPSAGITMGTAILSAVTGKSVRADTAMTGEITLRGRVLPVGGLKEKLLAAKSAGMKQVIVPAMNKAQIEEISEEITGGMKLVYAQTMQDVLSNAMTEQIG